MPIIEITLGAVFGGAVTYVIMERKLSDARVLIEAYKLAEQSLQLMRARVRAIQEHSRPGPKGERVYNIQRSDGRFGKMQLPEV
jgi:hypothetical protein